MTYVFKCPECGYLVESAVRDPAPECNHGDVTDTNEPMLRDYRAEAAGVQVAEMGRQREQSLDGKSGREAQRDVFLPTVAEYGEKYVRNWNDSHAPKSGNKSPLYPEVPKRSF